MDKNMIRPESELEDSIFLRKRVLLSAYTPERLSHVLHRTEQIKEYIAYMKDVFRDCVPHNIFVSGHSGTGKTMLTKLVLKDLLEVASEKRILLHTIYVNCVQTPSEYNMWRTIIAQMPNVAGVMPSSLGHSATDYRVYFSDLFRYYDGMMIIVFDELDKSHEPNIINSIVRTISNVTGYTPSVICITNDFKLKSQLEPHVRSVVGNCEIPIPPYNAEQLIDILRTRAEIAFRSGALDDVVIPLCAALSAQEHGDARRAIDILRIAGEIAEGNGANKIEEMDVRKAFVKVENDMVRSHVRQLPTQSKIVLAACICLLKAKRLEPTVTNLYPLYIDMCTAISLGTVTSRRVKDLVSELDIFGLISTGIQFKGRYGRQKIITEIASADEALNELLLDERVKFIESIIMKKR